MIEPIEWVQDSGCEITVPAPLRKHFMEFALQTGRIKVKVEGLYMERTELQNRKFHAKVNEMARHMDANREWVKARIKLKACEYGYPFEIVDGVAYPRSTRDANVEQLTLLIDTAIEFGHENGIYLE